LATYGEVKTYLSKRLGREIGDVSAIDGEECTRCGGKGPLILVHYWLANGNLWGEFLCTDFVGCEARVEEMKRKEQDKVDQRKAELAKLMDGIVIPEER